MTRIEKIAQAIYWGYVEWVGFPNGLLTYTELPPDEKARLRHQARWAVKMFIDIAKKSRRKR